MTLEEIIALTNNKLQHLQFHRELAFNRGDLEAVNSLDEVILTTQATLSQLLTLV